MSFYARVGSKEWNILADNIFAKRNLRLIQLDGLSQQGEKKELQIALLDRENDVWTKWKGFYHHDFNLLSALDIHRSLLWNEIVVESDYPTFQENYQAARIMGAVLEDKGFKPMYFYSGSKSIHAHVLFDFSSLYDVDMNLQKMIIADFTPNKFKKEFMTFLRLKMAKCWGINARTADEQVAGSKNHLIRAELSMNKQGFKTFIGYTYKDLSWIPPICNFENKILPRIGELVLSKPPTPVMQEIVEEFLEEKFLDKKKNKINSKIRTLTNWMGEGVKDAGDIKSCVKLILKPDNRLKADGYNRAFFILFNELRRVYDLDRAKSAIESWNSEMGTPIRQGDIDFRSNQKVYTLSCKYIHSFLGSCGYSESEYNH